MWAHNIPATWVKEERGRCWPWWEINWTLQAAGTRNLPDPEPHFPRAISFHTGKKRDWQWQGNNSLSARIHSTNTANKEEKVLSFLFVITLFCHCCQDVPMQYVALWCLVPVCFIFSCVGCTVISHSFALSILCVLFRFLHLQDFGKPSALLATLSFLPHLNLLCQFSSRCLGDDSLYICTHKWIC